jgi:hypothetical protein
MTISSTVSKTTLDGNGVQTSWPFAFKVWKSEDLQILITDENGFTQIDENWLVSLASVGGTVTYPTAGDPLPLGHKITIKRSMDFLQDVDLVSGTRWDPEVLETALDKAAAERQQILEELGRSAKIDIASEDTPDELIASIFAAQAGALAAEAGAGAAEAGATAQAGIAAGHADNAEQSAIDAELAAASIGILSSEGELAEGQDTIVLPWVYDPLLGNVAVYLNGVKQAGDTLTFVDANTVRVGDVVTETTTWEAVSVTVAGESVLTALRDQAEAARDAAQLYKMPIGMVFPFAGTTAPAGSVALQGQLLSRTGYADLWAHAQTSGNMAASDGAWTKGKFSPGDGSTTFRVMDLRDQFIRGSSGSRVVGFGEEDAIRNITGTLGPITQSYTSPMVGTGAISTTSGGSIPEAGANNRSQWNATFNASLVVPTADENRPVNVAYLWCIKAFDVISNPAILNAQAVVNEINRLDADKLDAAEIVAPGDAPKYVCRAWVNFDGTTTPPSIRASGNVSSVTREATGSFTVNFITPMGGINYIAVTSVNEGAICRPLTRTLSSIVLSTFNTAWTAYNVPITNIAIFT